MFQNCIYDTLIILVEIDMYVSLPEILFENQTSRLKVLAGSLESDR